MKKQAKKKAPKAIRIVTLQDLLDVATPENFQLLMKDTALWLHSMLLVRTLGCEVKDAAMEWTDDGVNEISGYDIKIRKP